MLNNSSINTMLFEAVKNGKLNKIKKLLKEHTIELNITLEPHSHFNLIANAAYYGKFKILKYLLETYEEKIDYSGLNNILIWASKCENSTEKKEILNYLFDKFKTLHFTDGTTKAHVAAAYNQKDFFADNKQESIKNTSKVGITPKYYAYINGSREVLELYDGNESDFKEVEYIENKENDFTNDDWRSLAIAQNSLAYYCFKQNKLDKTIKYYKQTIESYKNINNKTDADWRKLAQHQHSLGSCYFRQNNLDEVTPYYEQAIESCNKIIDDNKTDADWQSLANNQSKLIICYQEIGEIKKARDTLCDLISTTNQNLINQTDFKLHVQKTYKKALDLYPRSDKLEHHIFRFACMIFNDNPHNFYNSNNSRGDSKLSDFNSLYADVIDSGKQCHFIQLREVIEIAEKLQEKNCLPDNEFSRKLKQEKTSMQETEINIEGEYASTITQKKETLKSTTGNLKSLLENNPSTILALNNKIQIQNNEIQTQNKKLEELNKKIEQLETQNNESNNSTEYPVFTTNQRSMKQSDISTFFNKGNKAKRTLEETSGNNEESEQKRRKH